MNLYSIKTDKDGNYKSIKYNRRQLCDYIMSLGYYRYDIDEDNSVYVHIHDKKMKIVTKQSIIDDVLLHISKLPVDTVELNEQRVSITPAMLLDSLVNDNIELLYSHTLELLKAPFEIKLEEDTRHEKYLYFKNTAIAVSADGYRELKYSDLNNCIWETSIIPHTYDYIEEKGDFEKFIDNISGKNSVNKKSLMSMLGYLLHDNYERDAKAVLLTDRTEEYGKSNGGTGKGILGKALSLVLNATQKDTRYIAVNGKGIDLENQNKYSQGDVSTQLIHIEDLRKGVDFELLYNDITDGAIIRRPYQTVPVKKMVKIMISVNHTIQISNESSKMRRIYLFELSNYYSNKFTPEMEFGRRFFESQWTEYDWMQFYSFMVRCLILYLHDGVSEPTRNNYQIRELIEHTNEDFVYWFHGVIGNSTNEQSFVKLQLYEAYLEKYPGIKLSTRTLYNWMRAYLNAKNQRFVEIRSTQDMIIINPSESSLWKAKQQKMEIAN